MIRISTVARLSLGLVLITITILLGADMLGLIPTPLESITREREKICESLAVYCTVVAQKNDTGMILTAVQALVERNEDVLSAAIRKKDGSVMLAAGNHSRHWKGAPEKKSTPAHVRVPIFEDDSLWGTVEVSFTPLTRAGIQGVLENTLVRLIAFVVLAGFIVYRLFLKKTLQHLDPTSVVPPRVRVALDSLAEGLILLDKNERIVHANAAFLEKVSKSSSSVIGRKASQINWTMPGSTEPVANFPWQESLGEGKKSRTGVRLGLPVRPGHWWTFMVNSAPILDGNGKCRGALATFDDVTKMDEQNHELQLMLKKLEASRDEISRQNKELEVLATIDPLTGCLNRRAFFERFENHLSIAKRHSHDIACIMMDIDHFKKINDTHGHSTGDKVLRGVTNALQVLLRKGDFIGRYGGEEFVVILPHVDADGAFNASERFRLSIEALDFSGIHVTASFGVSSAVLGACDSGVILNQADEALYFAKDGGRNQVAAWGKLGEDHGGQELIDMASIFQPGDGEPDTDAAQEIPGAEDSSAVSRRKNALEMLGTALKDATRESESMGLRASLDPTGDAAVKLNQEGTWSDDPASRQLEWEKEDTASHSTESGHEEAAKSEE